MFLSFYTPKCVSDFPNTASKFSLSWASLASTAAFAFDSIAAAYVNASYILIASCPKLASNIPMHPDVLKNPFCIVPILLLRCLDHLD